MYIQNKRFAHLTQEERFHIEALREEHYTYRKIAQSLGRDISVISREIARNKRSDGRYRANIAQKKRDKRRALSKQGSRKIENNRELEKIIENDLLGDDPVNGDWSPEVIANTTLKGVVSHTTIYAWIKRSRRDLIHLLPNQGRRRATYGSMKTRKHREMTLPSIDIRPEEVESRTELGHFEGDTVVLKEGRLHTLAC